MTRPTPRLSGRLTPNDKEAIIDYIEKNPEQQESLLKEFSMTLEEYELMKERFDKFSRLGLFVTRTGHNRKKEQEDGKRN